MIHKNNGLKPLKKDKRDFNHNKYFGVTKNSVVNLSENGLNRKPISIKDQQTSQFCTGFAIATASEYQEGIELSPEYQVAKVGQVMGEPILNGAEPRSAMKSAVVYGSIPQSLSPFKFSKDGWYTPAFWNKYPESLDLQASTYKKHSYFRVTYGFPDDLDVYDSIRVALYQAEVARLRENHNKIDIVMAFGLWFSNWNYPQNAIVGMPIGEPITRHAYTFIDWKMINGKQYLVAQLSQGTNFGDNGLLYFSREVVNKAFENSIFNGTGLFIFRDIPSDQVKGSNLAKITLFDIIKKIWQKIF